MPLSAGEKLGAYEIVAAIGKGGMGEVWRARDSRLGRDVAIKVSAQQFTDRFEREARAIAALNHSNICTLYDVGPSYLVMEYIEGATLAERIKEGPIPLGEALAIAKQIADALEAAHEKKIVHRDLKPANVKIRPDGSVKVLDFGLAKASDAQEVTADSPTMMPGTQIGMILGTAAYMSPEQARGKQVDKRADIWAFGVVLYEMVTGKPLFPGENVTEVLAQVIASEPEISAAPAELRPLLRRCLERDPAKRLRDIGDVWISLETAPAAPASLVNPRPSRAAWLLAAACAALALAFAVLWLRAPAQIGPPVRFPLDRPVGLSPDGRLLVRGTRPLQVRRLDEGDWKDLPNTRTEEPPFWSEDSSALGFFDEGRLKVVGIDGKSPVRDLAAAPDPAGGTWRGGMSDGKIVFAASRQLHEIDLAGGTVRDLQVPLDQGGPATNPLFLPEGDAFVFLGPHGQGRALLRARLGNPQAVPERLLDTSTTIAFGRNPHTGKWHIFYNAGSRTVVTAPIDPKTGVAQGPAVQVLDGISSDGRNLMQFDASRNGTAIWRRARIALPIWRLRWFDRSGAGLGTVSDPDRMVSVALSPDENRAAVEQGINNEEIWMYNLQRASGARFSTQSGVSGNPLWSPDGSFVYYTVSHAGSSSQWAVMRQPATASDAEIVMRAPEAVATLSLQAVTPDGRSLVIIGRVRSELKSLLLRGDLATGTIENLLPGFDTSRIGLWARIMPDGRWLLFSAADTPGGLYAVPYPPQGAAPRRVTTTPIQWPFLSKDGRFLFGSRESATAGISVHPVVSGPGTLRIGEPAFAFPIESPARVSANIGAVSRDGSRILLIAGDETDEIKPQILTDWTVLLGGAH
jgi:eukaryotic-like serine/threonine-protein kinase